MSLSITILGCGSSSGVPTVGNNWGKCNPKNKKNYRLRSSILVEHKNTVILVDATPDLRQQLINAKVKKIVLINISKLIVKSFIIFFILNKFFFNFGITLSLVIKK